ncbi:MAG TPA: hypothetical protein VFQ52_02885, partial [Rhizomicrobium sp.]|nr:hypothetical protein [Rhizomicrobium sp.]
IERLNVGVIAGVPIGAVAYLVANRLLPIGMTARADAEVSVALWSAAVALVLGAALRPALGWPVLLGALALGCAAAPLPGPLANCDPVLLTGNLLLFALALALGGLAVALARRLRLPTPALRVGTRRAA